GQPSAAELRVAARCIELRLRTQLLDRSLRANFVETRLNIYRHVRTSLQQKELILGVVRSTLTKVPDWNIIRLAQVQGCPECQVSPITITHLDRQFFQDGRILHARLWDEILHVVNASGVNLDPSTLKISDKDLQYFAASYWTEIDPGTEAFR